MRQDEWVTRMARLAATDFGADWVLNAYRGRVLVAARWLTQDVLALVPERYGLVRGCWRHFLPARGRAGAVRGAHDRPAVRACASGRKGDDLPCAPEGRPPRRSRRLDCSREPRRLRPAPGVPPFRGWHPLECPALLPALGVTAPAKGGPRLARLGSESPRADTAPGPRVRGRSRRTGRGVLRLVRGERRRARAWHCRRQARRGHEAPGRAEGDPRRRRHLPPSRRVLRARALLPRPDVDDDAYAERCRCSSRSTGSSGRNSGSMRSRNGWRSSSGWIVPRARHRLARR